MRPRIKVYKLSWYSNIHNKSMEKIYYSREDHAATIEETNSDSGSISLHPAFAPENVYFRQVGLLTPEEFWAMCDSLNEGPMRLGPDMGDISIM